MSEPADGTGAARLDELAAVTKEYARYSRSRAGLAHAVYGAWLLAAGWMVAGGAWPRLADVLYVSAPLVWMGALIRTRQYYQRRGEVVEREEDWSPTPARATALFFTYFLSVEALWIRTGPAQSPPSMFVIAAYVATPVVAATITRGIADASFVLTCAMMAMGIPRPLPPPFWCGAMTASAALFVGMGLVQHVRFRRLERRLAALKGGAA